MKNVIEIKNLTKRFGTFTAVDRMNLTVREGEIFGFLGPNGAGKTTTISMLTTLIKPTEGAVTIAGHDLGEGASIRSVIGVVPQSFALFPELTAMGSVDEGKAYRAPGWFGREVTEDKRLANRNLAKYGLPLEIKT